MRRTTGSRYSERRMERNDRQPRKKAMPWGFIVIIVLLVIVLLFSFIYSCQGKTKEEIEREKAAMSLLSSGNVDYENVEIEAVDTTGYKDRPFSESELAPEKKARETEEKKGQVSIPLEMPGKLSCPEIILQKDAYIVSYNIATFCPNYVAWHLTPDRVNGSHSRSSADFHPDESLEERYQVVKYDYSGSGFDRGHMCPAADNKDTREHMYESFAMTNICPQNRNLNAGAWQDLEEQCRRWALQYRDVYIACGPIFQNDTPNTIGVQDRMEIAVPDYFFKVVLVMGEKPKALGFIYPNTSGHKALKSYCVSVDSVEEMSGIDFYPSLDDRIENKIESECLPSEWGI